jgi:hypothetical protein
VQCTLSKVFANVSLLDSILYHPLRIVRWTQKLQPHVLYLNPIQGGDITSCYLYFEMLPEFLVVKILLMTTYTTYAQNRVICILRLDLPISEMEWSKKVHL